MNLEYLLGFDDLEENRFYYIVVNKDSLKNGIPNLLTHKNEKIRWWVKVEHNKVNFSGEWQRLYKEKQLRVIFVGHTPENEKSFQQKITDCLLLRVLKDMTDRLEA